jgi:5'-nucleotidase
MTLTGDQLFTLFNQQWSVNAAGSEMHRPLQVSNLRVTWDAARPRGDRIVSLATGDGQLIDRGARYTITVNSFLAGGGDAFSVLTEGTEREVGPSDHSALVDFVRALPQPFNTTTEGRLQRV